jgi:predicted deacylase
MTALQGSKPPTRIFTDIDYERSGKQVGWLGLNHSVTRSAYGAIMIPVAVIKNGTGPTAFFQAGNHGDEYEGQVALAKLIRGLQPEQVQGRVIILPAANLPAAMAGARVSPIDDGNLNRSFPGSPDGTVTQQIAHYIDTVLFPLADLFHDLHSGGSSLDYVPFASVHHGWDAEINARGLAALNVFGMPLSVIWKTHQDVRFAPVAAMTHGMPSLGGEFGGGGRVERKVVQLVERGLMNTLIHMGIVEKPKGWAPPPPTRLVEVPSRESFVYAPEPGLFEPAVDLGDTVEPGQLCGEVHFVDNPARAPVPCHFRAGGFVICKRHFGRVERGDCVAHLANDVA